MCFSGILVSLALLPVGMLMGYDHSFAPEALCWTAVILAALGVAGIGTFRLRFEPDAATNKSLHATAAAPGM